jgi:hypothetical protein
MNLIRQLSPAVTTMIRLDHTHVMTTFHRFHAATSPMVKRGLVRTVCLALEIHAQLEEEVFYPALRQAGIVDEVLDKSVPEHDEMRRLIARLRAMEPEDPAYDSTFMALVRDVMHHVADEETVLLPAAERLLADQLRPLGEAMTKRRLELLAPRSGELAVNLAKSHPVLGSALLLAGAALAGTFVARRALGPDASRI